VLVRREQRRQANIWKVRGMISRRERGVDRDKLKLPKMLDLIEMPSLREIHFVRRIDELPEMRQLDEMGELRKDGNYSAKMKIFALESLLLHQLMVDSPDWLTYDGKDWYSSA